MTITVTPHSHSVAHTAHLLATPTTSDWQKDNHSYATSWSHSHLILQTVHLPPAHTATHTEHDGRTIRGPPHFHLTETVPRLSHSPSPLHTHTHSLTLSLHTPELQTPFLSHTYCPHTLAARWSPSRPAPPTTQLTPGRPAQPGAPRPPRSRHKGPPLSS